MKSVTANSDIFRLSTLGFLLAGMAIGVLALSMQAITCLLLAGGLISLWGMLKRPELGILTIVVLICSIVFEESLPLISIGVGSLQITDVILMAFLARLAVEIVLGHIKMVRTPLDLPLFIFIGTVLYSTYNGIFNHGIDFNVVVRILRGFVYYLLFFLITNHIKNKGQVWFIVIGLYVIGVVVAGSMILQSVVGDTLQLVPGRVEKAGTFEVFDTLRILPPGQTLIFCLLIMSICLTATTPKQHLITAPPFYLILVLGAGVLLTYNRTYWVAMILSIVTLLAVSVNSERKRIVVLLGLMALLAALVAAYSISTGTLSQTRQAMVSRFTSLFAGRELKDSGPIDDRITENRYALVKIKESPLLGNGLGNAYRPAIYGWEDELFNYIHNGYFYLLLNTGCIGTSCFLWFYLLFLIRGTLNLRRIKDPSLRSVLAGSILSCLGLAAMAPANPIFMQWFSIVPISILAGLSETIICINRSEASVANG